MPAIHPNLAQLYSDKVSQLEKELDGPAVGADAKSILRSMIQTIIISPGPARGQVELELHGELAALLALGQGGPKAQANRNLSLGGCGGAQPPLSTWAQLRQLDLQLGGLRIARGSQKRT
jgi:hypothetical protein